MDGIKNTKKPSKEFLKKLRLKREFYRIEKRVNFDFKSLIKELEKKELDN